MGVVKKGRVQTPLRAFKKSLGEVFASGMWNRYGARWWDEYLEARCAVDPRSRTQAEEMAVKIADKPYRNEWVYLLLVDGFFESDDLEGDGATRAAMLHMRMHKRMSKTHEHDLRETRLFGAVYDDLPNPASAHPEMAALKLGALNCWGGDPGRFRPLRTSDARRHPGWVVAGRHAARLCFEPASPDAHAARMSFDALRAFCLEMNEELADAGENIGPLVYLLHQELAASPGVSDSYRADFYATVLAGYLIALVHGTAALYEYGLVQRRSSATVDASFYDAGFEAGSARSSRFVASVFLVDSATLAPLSAVRAVDLDPAATYLVGRAPFRPEGAAGESVRLLLLPGGDSVSRHAFTLRYDVGLCAWIAEGSRASSRQWYVGGPDAASFAAFAPHRSGDRVALSAGSRIVLLRSASLAEGAVGLPSVMVALSYAYDQLDGGGWGRWAKAEEFLSLGARDVWIDAFEGRVRPLYIPEDVLLLSRQWEKTGRGERVPEAWSDYLESARDFLAEAAALSPDVRGDAAEELSDACDAVRRMAKRMAKIIADAPSCSPACRVLHAECVALQGDIDRARRRDERDASIVREARRLMADGNAAGALPSAGFDMPSKAAVETVADAMVLFGETERERALALLGRYVADLHEFRCAFERSDAGYAALRSASDAAARTSASLRRALGAWGAEGLSELDDFDAWLEGAAKLKVNAARRKESAEK